MRRSTALLASIGALAMAATGCGAEDHPNGLRPPSPIEVSALVNSERVVISPKDFGAGLANFTISNQSADRVQLTFDGPVDAAGEAIGPGSVAQFKVDLRAGDYQVEAGPDSFAEPADLVVGPERESAQNDLLLP